MNPGLLSAVLGCAESRVGATTALVLVPVTGPVTGVRRYGGRAAVNTGPAVCRLHISILADRRG